MTLMEQRHRYSVHFFMGLSESGVTFDTGSNFVTLEQVNLEICVCDMFQVYCEHLCRKKLPVLPFIL